MTMSEWTKNRRVLIASSHPLFGKGLQSLLNERRQAGVEVVGMVKNLEEALREIDRLNPDLVIVDYDDEILNRDEFLARFVEGEKKLRVVLLSLQSAGEAIVYDRRTLAASQIDNWLEEWTYADRSPETFPPAAQRSPRFKPGRWGAGRLGARLASKPERVNKEVEDRRTDMKHLVVAGILVLVVTALLIVGLQYAHLLPVEASAQAVPIDSLFNLEFKVIAFLFSLIVVFMLYSIVVFRRKPGDLTDAAHIEGNSRLEVLWTLAPLATVLYFAWLGGQSLAQTMRADPKPLEIKVVSQQWSWRFEYPDQGIVSTDLYMPVNQQALLHLSSNDVIHSFWVPEFRVKQDALPGGDAFVRDLRVTPTRLGDYKVRCSELCGLQHALMLAPVHVISQADFDAWVAQQTGGSTDPVVRGQKTAQTYGCVTCHSADGTKLVGPSWKGLYGSQVALADGTSVTADDAYIHESILNPNAKIVQGFAPGVMPQTFASQLSDKQISDLIEYIKSLK